VASLGTAFNLALVADGIRPSFPLTPKEAPIIRKLIGLYATKLLAVQGNSLVVSSAVSSGKHKPNPAWPLAPSLTTSMDSHLFYHMDAFILCHNSKTKEDSGAVFYSYEAPEPLSHASQTNLYHCMLQSYNLARRLSSTSEEGLVLRVDVVHHKVLSPTMVHGLTTSGTTTPDLDLLLTYLHANGFAPVADVLQSNPHLLASDSFRKGVLSPLFIFEQSGVLSTLKLTHVKHEALQSHLAAWCQALLSTAYSNNNVTMK
jgi:hypothetical protein